MRRAIACLLIGLASCAAAPVPETSAPAVDQPVKVGGDRDAHGCIGSAGYRWCARTQRCERPWELAAAQGLDNSAEGVGAWCAAKR